MATVKGHSRKGRRVKPHSRKAKLKFPKMYGKPTGDFRGYKNGVYV